jgi:hypothetical protein
VKRHARVGAVRIPVVCQTLCAFDFRLACT